MKVLVVAYHHEKKLFQGEHDSPLVLEQPIYEGGKEYRVVRKHSTVVNQIVILEEINHG